MVHYGDGRWFTVDSCLAEGGRPAALVYLEALGLAPNDVVTHTVVTHPDADHIGGIQELYETCSNSRLVCSALLAEKDMASYLAIAAKREPDGITADQKQLIAILKLARARSPHYGPIYVKEDVTVFREQNLLLSGLSPSNGKFQSFLTRVAVKTAEMKRDPVKPVTLSPNAVSAALLLELPNAVVLLGADLEEAPGQGWTTIMASSSNYRASKPVTIFKIAHHGSPNADHPPLWAAMRDPVGLLAPFNYGRNKLPSESDVSRILGVAPNSYATSKITTDFRRVSVTDRVLNRHGIRRKPLYPPGGHIRVRVNPSGQRTTDLFGGAVHLKQMY